MHVKVNIPQHKFLSLQKKNRAYIGGFGAGKTWAGATATAAHFWMHPRVKTGYFAPTYPHIRDIYYPTIEEVAHSCGQSVKIKDGNHEVHHYVGRVYRGTTICRSMDNPGKIIGFKIGHAHVDEIDVLKKAKAEDAHKKILARMRYKVDGLRNGVDFTSTPEGYGFMYETFVKGVDEKPEFEALYGIVRATTYDNAKNLPDDYIDNLLASYPKKLIQAYLMGEFVNLTGNTVVYNYDRSLCRSTETIIPGERLYIGQDFNIAKMASVVYVKRDNGYHAVAELVDLFDTEQTARKIKEQFAGHNIYIYPDASGQNRGTSSGGRTDHDILKSAGFTVIVDAANPLVRDRINCFVAAIDHKKVYINDKACPKTSEALQNLAYKDGEPDKKSGYDHLFDAATYPISKLLPIKKVGLTTKIKGFL